MNPLLDHHLWNMRAIRARGVTDLSEIFNEMYDIALNYLDGVKPRRIYEAELRERLGTSLDFHPETADDLSVECLPAICLYVIEQEREISIDSGYEASRILAEAFAYACALIADAKMPVPQLLNMEKLVDRIAVRTERAIRESTLGLVWNGGSIYSSKGLHLQDQTTVEIFIWDSIDSMERDQTPEPFEAVNTCLHICSHLNQSNLLDGFHFQPQVIEKQGKTFAAWWNLVATKWNALENQNMKYTALNTALVYLQRKYSTFRIVETDLDLEYGYFLYDRIVFSLDQAFANTWQLLLDEHAEAATAVAKKVQPELNVGELLTFAVKANQAVADSQVDYEAGHVPQKQIPYDGRSTHVTEERMLTAVIKALQYAGAYVVIPNENLECVGHPVAFLDMADTLHTLFGRCVSVHKVNANGLDVILEEYALDDTAAIRAGYVRECESKLNTTDVNFMLLASGANPVPFDQEQEECATGHINLDVSTLESRELHDLVYGHSVKVQAISAPFEHEGKTVQTVTLTLGASSALSLAKY